MTMDDFAKAMVEMQLAKLRLLSASLCGLAEKTENPDRKAGILDAVGFLETSIKVGESIDMDRILQKSRTLRQGFEQIMANKVEGDN